MGGWANGSSVSKKPRLCTHRTPEPGTDRSLISARGMHTTGCTALRPQPAPLTPHKQTGSSVSAQAASGARTLQACSLPEGHAVEAGPPDPSEPPAHTSVCAGRARLQRGDGPHPEARLGLPAPPPKGALWPWRRPAAAPRPTRAAPTPGTSTALRHRVGVGGPSRKGTRSPETQTGTRLPPTATSRQPVPCGLRLMGEGEHRACVLSSAGSAHHQCQAECLEAAWASLHCGQRPGRVHTPWDQPSHRKSGGRQRPPAPPAGQPQHRIRAEGLRPHRGWAPWSPITTARSLLSQARPARTLRLPGGGWEPTEATQTAPTCSRGRAGHGWGE